jgi:hypothetical protein
LVYVFQFADTRNNTTSSENSQHVGMATDVTGDDLGLPGVEQNNNTPDAVNANLCPKVATNTLSQTSKSASIVAVTSEGDKDLSSVPGILNATSQTHFTATLTPSGQALAINGTSNKTVTYAMDDTSFSAGESADKVSEVCNCVWTLLDGTCIKFIADE